MADMTSLDLDRRAVGSGTHTPLLTPPPLTHRLLGGGGHKESCEWVGGKEVQVGEVGGSHEYYTYTHYPVHDNIHYYYYLSNSFFSTNTNLSRYCILYSVYSTVDKECNVVLRCTAASFCLNMMMVWGKITAMSFMPDVGYLQ